MYIVQKVENEFPQAYCARADQQLKQIHDSFLFSLSKVQGLINEWKLINESLTWIGGTCPFKEVTPPKQKRREG